MNFDVLIIGGGISGTAAGIQAARLGAKTLIVEETAWLGGMVTAAGVSAFDGNKYAFGGGLFGEYRKRIEDYYGGPRNTFTGWISLTCFEPKLGNNILQEMVLDEPNLTIWYNTTLIKVLKTNNTITGAVFKNPSGEHIEIVAAITIEATEWGDVISAANIPNRLGRDSKSDTNEPDAPLNWDDKIQDMTYCAILKKFQGIAPKVEPTEDYKPELFINSTSIVTDETDPKALKYILHDWDSFISYAELPNQKYLLNWPFKANDYNPTPLEIYEKPETRLVHFKKAKQHTLNYIHYIQTELGHPEWGLCLDEFPTADGLPFIPYVRESRRIKGLRLMVEDDVVPQPGSFRPKLVRSGIAVGDYFLDHHHASFFNQDNLEEPLPANAPFQIPYECLIPKDNDGIIIAEKSISVTHIVNGCTRLQPVVMLIGQAAGAAAALCAKKGLQPRDLNVVELQDVLIHAGAQVYPYKDVYSSHTSFRTIQKLALEGLIMDNNEFYFMPQQIVTLEEEIAWKKQMGIQNNLELMGKSRATAFEAINNHLTKD